MAVELVGSITIVQAVDLVRHKAAAEISSEEIVALRNLVDRNPSCCTLLGGRDIVESYLAEAQRRQAERLAKQATAAASRDATGGSGESGAAVNNAIAAKPRQRPLLELALFVSGLLAACGVAYLLFGRNAIENRNLAGGGASGTDRPDDSAASAIPTKSGSNAHSHPAAATQAQIGGAADERQETAEIDRPDRIDRWNGWDVTAAQGAAVAKEPGWNTDDPLKPQPTSALVVGGGPVSLAASRRVDAAHRWLLLKLLSADGPAAGDIEVLADGHALARARLEPSMLDVPILVSLHPLMGRTVRLEVRYVPETSKSSIKIWSIAISPAASRISWTPLVPVQTAADHGAILKILPDHSILASGPNGDAETYHVTVALPSEGATAVRLEALPDSSLPAAAAGRGTHGEFLLSRVSAVLTASVRQRQQIPARYVRVELLGPARALMLAEVEVLSRGHNVALDKEASQSTTVFGASAWRAVDGNRQNDFRQGSVSHTNSDSNAWWVVDLGRAYPVERITIWSRGENTERGLANHRVSLIGENKQTLWSRDNPYTPIPNVSYGPFETAAEPIRFSLVFSDREQKDVDLNETIKEGAYESGGWTGGGATSPASAVFVFAPQPKYGGEQVTFHLVHASANRGQNLGRFRLSTTAVRPPSQPEPPAVELPLLAR